MQSSNQRLITILMHAVAVLDSRHTIAGLALALGRAFQQSHSLALAAELPLQALAIACLVRLALAGHRTVQLICGEAGAMTG